MTKEDTDNSTPPEDIRRETALLWGRLKAWLWLMGALAVVFAFARMIGFL